MINKLIHSYGDLEKLVLNIGFLPFFRNAIPGFSVEEVTPEPLWFSDEKDGPWEWKGPVVRDERCAYGKMINKKAAFVSMEWFPDLVNYRRSVYPLDSDPDQSKDRLVYDKVVEYESLLSKDIKRMCGLSKSKKRKRDLLTGWESDMVPAKKESYDTVIIRLMMGTWLVIADFEYNYDRHGNPYGWGVARYTTPEILYGRERVLGCAHRSPEESRQRLTAHLTRVLPHATPAQISRIIG